MHDPIAPGQARETIDAALPSLAAIGGAGIGAALGPPRSARQMVIDASAAGLTMLIFGPSLCDSVGVSEKQHVIAVGGAVGVFGIVAMRSILAVVDSMYLHIEATKDQTAKGIVSAIYEAANRLMLPRILAWLRVPEHSVSPVPPPLPPPVVVLLQQPTVPPPTPELAPAPKE